MRREVAAVLRNTGSGWYVETSGNHTPLNVIALSQTSTYIRLTFSFTATEVHTCAVTLDEYYATRAITVGASVGLSYMDIYLGEITTSGPVALNPNSLTNPNGNIWVYVLLSDSNKDQR